MANLSPGAQTAVVAGAIASSLLLLFICLCTCSSNRKEGDESCRKAKAYEWREQEHEKQWPGYHERQRHASVSTYRSPLEYLAQTRDRQLQTPSTHRARREVRMHRGYIVNETRAMDPHTAHIQYAS